MGGRGDFMLGTGGQGQLVAGVTLAGGGAFGGTGHGGLHHQYNGRPNLRGVLTAGLYIATV